MFAPIAVLGVLMGHASVMLDSSSDCVDCAIVTAVAHGGTIL
jgi:hypothetical protein